MHESGGIATRPQAQLPSGFEEWQRLDVADGAADLDQRDVETLRATVDVVLDLVGDMWNDLHRLAEIFAAAFLADHRFINLAGREVVHLAHLGADEPLVVAQIQIGLRTIVGDEDFTMLERTHRAGVDIDVGIELQKGDFEAARFEDRSERGGGNSLAQGRDDAASDEHKLGHCEWCRKAHAGN